MNDTSSSPHWASANTAAADLYKLAKLVEQQTQVAKENGNLHLVQVAYLKQIVSDFKYGKEGNLSYGMQSEFDIEDKWHWKSRADFEKTILDSEPYKSAVKLVSMHYSKNITDAAAAVTRFWNTIQQSVENINEEDVLNQVAIFVGDLSGAPHQVILTGKLEGIWIPEGEVILSNGIVRACRASDFEKAVPLDLAMFHAPRGISSDFSAIFEFAVRCTAPHQAQMDMDKFVSCLRLFKLGSVKEQGYEMRANSILSYGGSIFSSLPPARIFRYPLYSSDAAKLEVFIQKFKDLVPSEYNTGSNSEFSPEDLAFRRYSDSVLRTGEVEGRITAAITCLEALFLKSSERSELTYKLSVRVATLLRFLRMPAMEIQRDVKQAYDIRSTYIHGSEMDPDKKQVAPGLSRKISEYARLCVIIFLQLKSAIKKDDFLAKLDNAIFDEKASRRIVTLLSKFMIPRTKGKDVEMIAIEAQESEEPPPGGGTTGE